MNDSKTLITAACAMLVALTAQAAVSPEEAARLGKDLTPVGAEMAGNKDGSIPAYSGGLTTAPDGFVANSGNYVDPFKDEKPLFSITAQNMAQYADKLSEGQKLLLTRNPAYRMDIYPTHRTAAFPEHVLQSTIKNATTAKTTAGGIGVEGASGGLPFPIPQDGYEVMWNHLLTYQGDVIDFPIKAGYAGKDGHYVLTSDSPIHYELPYYQPNNPLKDKIYFRIFSAPTAPGALAGQLFSYTDPLDFSKADRHAYQYIPGQRRVKVTPEFSYDTPNPGGAGLITFDDVALYSGKMDRYAFKLLGKKEMYIPYNNYRALCKAPSEVFGPGYLKPEVMRYELHRVWVVEATLLPGKRHIYKKRMFYWDEDGYGYGMTDAYDNADKLLRHGYIPGMQLYDKKVPWAFNFVFNDFSSNVVVGEFCAGTPVKAGIGNGGPGATRAWSEAEWSPEAMAGRGVR